MQPSRRFQWISRIYAAVFFGGACVHGYDILMGGLSPRSRLPVAVFAYWDSLLLFDSLAVVLILFHRRSALFLAVAIMASDIAVNVYAARLQRLSWPDNLIGNFPFILFGCFVFSTARALWNEATALGWAI
jgi:hypothetical protein